MGYTNRSYPVLTEEGQVNSVTYYDDYTFLSSTSDYTFQSQSDLGLIEYFGRVKGSTTGTKTRIIGTSEYLQSVIYYDKKFRPIQTITANHKGGNDRVSIQYDFEGKIIQKKRQHVGQESITIAESYTYDHTGRPLKHFHKINNQTQVLLSEQRYNALGQHIEKNLHQVENSNQFMQSVDLEYNIRGWQTGTTGQSTEPEALYKDFYNYRLAYNETLPGFNNQKQYNGNISAYLETRPFEEENSQVVQNGYVYTYTANDFIAKAQYVRPSNTLLNNAYNEVLNYDANGNINRLKRNGLEYGTPKEIDNLFYDYNGNQLSGVKDDADAEQGFKKLGSSSGYTYDANGNMISDGNKDITNIEYNSLNLPSTVTFADGRTVEFIYTSSGEKLKQIVKTPDKSIKVQYDYLGGILYKMTPYNLFHIPKEELCPYLQVNLYMNTT
jgi:hypothetical protein